MIRHPFPRVLMGITILLGLIWVGLVVLTGNEFASANPPGSKVPGAQANQTKRNPFIDERNLKWVGVGSCASSTCHHRPFPKGHWRSAYGTWAAYDPHTQAYRVLETERSANMVKLYTRGRNSKAGTEPLCLKCHAMNDGLTKNVGHRFTLADGVGCESCHGPAEKWLRLHYRGDWEDRTGAQKTSLGFRNTKDLRVRAELCATCHVGNLNKEVNHDLIAAGHPRLNFEFGTYHAMYPQHWGKTDKGDTPHPDLRPDLTVRLWSVGQLVSAKVALELLRDRAQSSLKGGAYPAPWPEYSEYGCFSCHQDLRSDLPGDNGRRLGSFEWGTWYVSMVQEYAAESSAAGGIQVELDKLRKLLENQTPSQTRVIKQVSRTLTILERWMSAEGRDRAERHLPASAVKRLMRNFAKKTAANAHTLNWDEAAQRYLALAALYNGLGKPPPPRNDPLGRELLDMKHRLKQAYPKDYNSPRSYNPTDPKAPLGDLFRAVHKKLLAP